MPNEFLPSDDAINGALAPTNGDAPAGGALQPSDDIIDQAVSAQKTQLSQSLTYGVTRDPVRSAEELRLSQNSGIPADIVGRHADMVKQGVRLKSIDQESIHRDYPQLARWLSDANNASISHDDVPGLQAIDRTVRQLSATPGDDPLGILPPGFRFGQDGKILEPDGTGLAQEFANMDALRAELQRRGEHSALEAMAQAANVKNVGDRFGVWADYVAGAASSLAATQSAVGQGNADTQNAAAALDAASQAGSPGFGGTLRRGVGGVVADIPLMFAGGPLAEGASALMKLTRARAIIAPIIGKNAAKAAATFVKTAASVQPLAIREGASDAEQNGAGFGAMAWLIETAVPGAFGRTGIQRALVPGVDKIASEGAKSWAEAAGKLLKDAGLEGTEESITELAHAIHESASGTDPNALKAANLLPRMLAAGVLGGAMGGVFNAPEVLQEKFHRDALQIRQSTLEANSIRDAFTSVQASPVRERSPDRISQLIDGVQQDAGLSGQSLFFNQEAWNEHWTARGEDPQAAAVRMGVDPAAYAAARASGAQLSVPTARFLSQTVEDDAPLIDRATLRPDALSAAEMAGATDQLKADVAAQLTAAKSASDAASGNVNESAQLIQTDVEAQLVAAGTNPKVARSQAKLWSEGFKTLATRFNEGRDTKIIKAATKQWAKDHSGNQPDKQSDEWKSALATAEATFPKVDPKALFDRYKLTIAKRVDTQTKAADGKTLDTHLAQTAEPDLSALSQAARDYVSGLTPESRAGLTPSIDYLRANPDPQGDLGNLQMIEQGNRRRVARAFNQTDPADAPMSDTIEVEGKQRPTLNSNGKRIAQSEESVRNFWRWFNESKTVDSNGRPLVVYHGTSANFTSFSTDSQHKSGRNVRLLGDGIYFTSDISQAQKYGDSIISAYLKMETPRTHGANGMLVEKNSLQDGTIAVGTPGTRTGESIFLVKNANQIKASTGNNGNFDQLKANIFFQPMRRASITIGDGLTFDISLFGLANRSSFLHETGHAYLEVLRDLASRSDAPDTIHDDFDTIRDWLKNDGSEFTVDQHETFARGFERYLMEGKAPSNALRTAFANFKAWLSRIYNSVASLRSEISPEVRSVFDRILASDEAIVRAHSDLDLVSPWKNADEAGISEEQFDAYQKSVEFRSNLAADILRAKLMHAEFLAESDARAEERATVEQEETAKVDSQPVFTAIQALQSGVWPADTPMAEGKPKLSKEDILRFYPEAELAKLPGPLSKGQTEKANRGERVYTAKEGQGIPLAEAAQVFGFPDVDAFWQALTTAPDRDTLIGQRTDAEMAKRYPDPLIDGSLAMMAKAELADQFAGHVLVDEVKRLAAKVSGNVAPTEILRMTAREVIGRTKIRDIHPEVYQRAAAKASREAFNAAAKARGGTIDQRAQYDREAFEAKQRELFNLHLFRAARDATEDSEKGRIYLGRFDELKTRQRIGKAGGWEWSVYNADGSLATVAGTSEEAMEAARQIGGAYERTNGYLEQIDGLLEQYELRLVPTKRLLQRERLADWIRRKQDAGEDVNIPTEVQNAALQVNWRALTPTQQQGVLDAAKNIEALARTKNELLKSQGKRDMDAVRTELVDSITKNNRGVYVERDPGSAPLDRGVDAIRAFFREQLADSFLARRMDGGEDGGAVWNYFIRPRNVAADEAGARISVAAQSLDQLFRTWGRKRGLVREVIPGTRAQFTAEQKISIALNWGNAEGRQRILSYFGRKGYGEADVQAVLNSLDAKDHALINGLWSNINAYWSEIKALEQRVTGVAPDKVEATPFRAGDTMLPGGYWPLVYDEARSMRPGDLTQATEFRQAARGAYGRAQTKHGHTESRVQEAQGLALRLDFDVAGQHVSQVIHDLTHREMLIDQGKLLNDKAIAGAMQHYYGRNSLSQFLNTAVDIAVGERVSRDLVERAAKGVRKNLPGATFSYNISNALLNITGLTQSIPRVGSARLAWAIARIGRDAISMESAFDAVADQSPMMRERSRLRYKTVSEATTSVDYTGKGSEFLRIGMVVSEKVQQFVDTATWMAAQEKALKDGLNAGKSEADARKDAVAIADQAVIDTQASSRAGDKAAFLRGGELAKLFTSFMTYFNRAYNLQVETIRGAARGDQTWVKAAIDTLMLWTVPAAASAILLGAARGDEHKEGQFWERMAKAQLSYGAGMLLGVREFSGAVDGTFGYSGPAGLRSISAIYNLLTQVKQGHVDKGLVKALLSAGGLLGLPAVEANRLIDAIQIANDDGSASDAFRAAVFGAPRKQ